jgi:hypothetical protein
MSTNIFLSLFGRDMRFSTVIILLLLAVVGALVFYVFYAPPKMVTIVERPVYDYGSVSWRPWSWGGGGWGWPGSYYVNRPVPHFGPHPPHGGDKPMLGPGGMKKY